MFVKIKDIYVNTSMVSIAALRGSSLILDFAYSKPEGPVFVTIPFDTEEEALQALRIVTGQED